MGRFLSLNGKIEIEDGILNRLENIPILGKFLVFISDIFFSIQNYFIKNKNRSSKNICIISFHRLGDTVFTIPAIKVIYNYYKNYQIKIFCYPESKEIYNIVFDQNDIEVVTKSQFKLGQRIASKDARNFIRSFNPEIIFDITGTITTASLIFNLPSNLKIGMNNRIMRGIYTHYVKRRKTPHLIDNYLDVVKSVIPKEKMDIDYKFEFRAERNGKIIIHPFAIRKAKEWNLRKFILLAVELNKKYSVEIIAPPNFLADDIKSEIIQKGIPVTITTSISNLIDKIKDCMLFISNDTGPLYIANLLGKATFTIYGPTNPEFSLPFGEHHGFAQKKLMCSPEPGQQFCFTLAGIYCPHHDCFNLLNFDEVYSAVLEFIEELKSKNIKFINAYTKN